MKVRVTWKKDKVRITHTLIVDAQNIEEAYEQLKDKYPKWEVASVTSKEK